MPPEIQEKVREMAGLAGTGIGESCKISSFERRLDKFDWIQFFIFLIGPWVILIWFGIEEVFSRIEMAVLGAVTGIWSVHWIPTKPFFDNGSLCNLEYSL